MPPLRWPLLILAVLSESAVAYRGGPSAFARSVSHRQPSLARFAARAPVPACAATPPPDAAERERLPAAVLPITLTVFAQMIGEGLALTSLPLHMKSLGASTVMSGVAVSGFSLSSLIFTPVVVRISNRVGRYKVLRVCLLGCALAQLLIVQASTPGGVVVGRLVSGIFAASVPVAQAAVTDLVSPAQSALALSRVSAVSQLGVVVGPAFGALAIAVLNRFGVADIAGMHMRCVFAVSSAFAMGVLLLQFAFGAASFDLKPAEPPAELIVVGSEAVSPSGRRLSDALPLSSKATEVAEALPLVPLVRKRPYDQWALRLVAISIGWGLTLCMATYCLFGSAIVGYTQQRLSINFSVAAAVSVVAQLILFPKLVNKLGEHLVCAFGLTVSSIGLIGVSLFKLNPLHAAIYLITRTGNALGDTACATLVARASDGSEARARNLGAIYSVRAGARIVTPLLSAWLFEISRRGASGGGALPYFIVSAITAALIPVPLVLKSFEEKRKAE